MSFATQAAALAVGLLLAGCVDGGTRASLPRTDAADAGPAAPCLPGAVRCLAQGEQLCGAAGVWEEAVPCARDERCEEARGCRSQDPSLQEPCTPGQRACFRDDAYYCLNDAQWALLESCASGAYRRICAEGHCQGCEPGVRRCVGQQVFVCSDDGLREVLRPQEVCLDGRLFCEPVQVELELPLPGLERGLGVDVALLFDRSGSFADDLATLRSKAAELRRALHDRIADLTLGLASFIDAPCAGFGDPGDFGYRVDLRLTSQHERLERVLQQIDIRSGADVPEAQLEAMVQALTGQGLLVEHGDPTCRGVADVPASPLGWREQALHFLFVSTDAPFHRPGDEGYPYPHSAKDVVAAAQALGARVSFLQAGLGTSGQLDPAASHIAQASGGAVYALSEDSAEIASTVATAVLAALTSSRLELSTEGDEAGLVTDILPARLDGVDFSTNDSLHVRLTLLATVEPAGEPQTLSFDLVFRNNGAEIDRRQMQVHIAAVDAKDCRDRPPVLRRVVAPEQLGPGEVALLRAQAEDPDGDPVALQWSTDRGVLTPRGAREAEFQAPDQAGLCQIEVQASDPEDQRDAAGVVVQICDRECPPARRLDLGLTSGRVMLVGQTEHGVTQASCGGLGPDELFLLQVHRAGTYRIGVEPAAGRVLALREADCQTERSCATGGELVAELSEGPVFLVLDSALGASPHYRLFVEPL